jgi:hypothetical protein
MKKFKSQKTENSFKSWIKSQPESWHPYDTERFNIFVISLFLDNDSLTETQLKDLISNFAEWENEEFINEFVDRIIGKISDLRSFYDQLKNSNLLKNAEQI